MPLFLFRYHFRKEARALGTSALALGLTALLVSVLSQALNLEHTLKLFHKAFKKMPMLMRAIGGDLSFLDPSVVVTSALFTLVAPVFLVVYTTELAVGVYTREASNGTIEFLFSLPLKRLRLVTSKLLVLLANLAILSAVLALSVHAGLSLAGGRSDIAILAMLSISLFTLFACLAGIGFLISLAFTDHAKATLVVLGIGLGLFSLHALLEEGTNWLDWVNPYHYYAASSILRGDAFPWSQLGTLGLGAAIFWAGGMLLFVRKQI